MVFSFESTYNETAETELSAVSEVGKLGKDGFGQKCLGILCNLL